MTAEELKEALKNPDEAERIYAVEDVIDLKDSALMPVIIEHLYKEDSRLVRELIVEGLKVLDISDHYPSIAEYFESSDAFVRNCAIDIFGAKGEDAIPFLTSLMDHENKEVRKLILDSLVATSSKYSIPALRAALRDKAPNVMITAVEYLGKIYDEESMNDVMEILETVTEPMVRSSCLETITSMGDTASVDRVLEILGAEGTDSFYKPMVIKLAGEKGDKRHLDFLLSFLNNKNTGYFTEVANALLKLISREKISELEENHIKFILTNLRNSDNDVSARVAFLHIAVRMDLPEKDGLLEELAADESDDVSFTALGQLAQTNQQRAEKLIEKKIKLTDGEQKYLLTALLESIKG